jgi:hypothetical protein
MLLKRRLDEMLSDFTALPQRDMEATISASFES